MQNDCHTIAALYPVHASDKTLDGAGYLGYTYAVR